MSTSLLDQVKGRPKLVLADGGYDGRKSGKAIEKKGAKALIPPPKTRKHFHVLELSLLASSTPKIVNAHLA